MFHAKTWSIVGVLGATMISSSAHAQQSERFETWLGGQFRTVARSCLPASHSAANRAPEQYIPQDVRTWDTVSRNLNANASIYSLDSLGSYFGSVYLRLEDGSLTRDGLQGLGVTFAESDASTLYPRRANGTRHHNCSTMLTSSGNLNLNLGSDAFRTALNTSVTGSQTESLFLYSGTIVSPVAAALGLAASEVERRPNVDRFSIYLAVWQWYRLHSSMTGPGNADRLQITQSIDGAATYRVRGLTQDMLLAGNSRVAAGIPFLTASASASGTANWAIRENTTGFGIAVLNRHPGILPGPLKVARDAPRLATVTPVPSNPSQIDNGAAMTWAADLSGVPSAYCDTIFWQLQPASDSATDFTVTNLTAAPVPETSRVCRFSVRATPTPNTDGSNVAHLSFGVQSEVPNGTAGQSPHTLLIPIADTGIADLRASISLANPAGALEFAAPAADRTALAASLIYVVRETGAARVGDIVPGTTSVDLACGQYAPQGIPVAPEDIIFSRTGGQGRIGITVRLPTASLPNVEGGPVSCRLTGALTVTVQGSSPRTLGLPTHAFTLAAPAAPPAEPGREISQRN